MIEPPFGKPTATAARRPWFLERLPFALAPGTRFGFLVESEFTLVESVITLVESEFTLVESVITLVESVITAPNDSACADHTPAFLP
jgi:hypothetical protein